MINVRIAITLKQGVLDPQGKAIHAALLNYNFNNVNDVRQGKLIELQFNDTSLEQAKHDVNAMCEKLLANTVIEDFEILSIK